jgi:hypothetical protein
MYAIVFHAHQKINRVAYRHLRRLQPTSYFPGIRQILHFEGQNGPDAPKLKKPGQGEQPWHFVDPLNIDDVELHHLIDGHYQALVIALKSRDEIRSAFEAAWLAHALVDGLTPAHHYPYEHELALLRGEDRHSRQGLLGRAYVHGDTILQSIKSSLLLVGPKGLLTTHALFEAGAYAIIAPLPLKRALPSSKDIEIVSAQGVIGLFKQLATEIAELQLYARFYDRGWTQHLSRDIRRELAPRMVRMVTLAWYSAAREAEQAA